MNYVEEDFIETGTGIAFHFLEPKEDEIDIFDIANSLSNQCRYTGHVKKFYSVAEHCCHLYDYAKTKAKYHFEKFELKTILLHDASEAYLTDIARPIKNHIPDYRKLEVRIEEVVASKFGIVYPYPAWVKEYDMRILLDEREQVMRPSKNVWAVDGQEPLGVNINFWEPSEAFLNFLARYYECNG